MLEMRLMVMSDLHLSKKPWQVRCALRMGADADAVLLVGDLTNDGTLEQMELMHQCIKEVLPDTPVLAVTGNHDYP
ncbi:MAG: metallophosphoesterase, partial [Blautia sp.]